MNQSSAEERRYTEKDLGLILKRAAELQHRDTHGGSGLSLRDLEQVASEVGIDPAHVHQAIRELDSARHPGTPTRLLGGPTLIAFEQTVAGAAPRSAYEQLVEEIRAAVGALGEAHQLDGSLTWISRANLRTPLEARGADSPAWTKGGEMRAVRVTVSPQGGSTTIRIEERMGDVVGGVFGGIVGGVGGVGLVAALSVGLGVLGSVPIAAVTAVTVVGGSYLLARRVYRSALRKRTRRLSGLLQTLVAHVERTAQLPPEG